MLKYLANRLTDILYRHSTLDNTRRPVYVYGTELLFSTSFSILSILLISAVFSLIHYALTFLTVFISLRLFNGGYHAKTYSKCFLLTNAVYLAVIMTTIFIQNAELASINSITYVIITLISFSIIFVLSPIKHLNHPLSEERYRHNQRIGRSLAFFIAALNCLLIIYPIQLINPVLISFTLIAVAIMMIIPKYTERRK